MAPQQQKQQSALAAALGQLADGKPIDAVVQRLGPKLTDFKGSDNPELARKVAVARFRKTLKQAHGRVAEQKRAEAAEEGAKKEGAPEVRPAPAGGARPVGEEIARQRKLARRKTGKQTQHGVEANLLERAEYEKAHAWATVEFAKRWERGSGSGHNGRARDAH